MSKKCLVDDERACFWMDSYVGRAGGFFIFCAPEFEGLLRGECGRWEIEVDDGGLSRIEPASDCFSAFCVLEAVVFFEVVVHDARGFFWRDVGFGFFVWVEGGCFRGRS